MEHHLLVWQSHDLQGDWRKACNNHFRPKSVQFVLYNSTTDENFSLLNYWQLHNKSENSSQSPVREKVMMVDTDFEYHQKVQRK